jgi:hypothetical protein
VARHIHYDDNVTTLQQQGTLKSPRVKVLSALKLQWEKEHMKQKQNQRKLLRKQIMSCAGVVPPSHGNDTINNDMTSVYRDTVTPFKASQTCLARAS